MKNTEIEEAGYHVTKSVRIDAEMARKLEKIALYEKIKLGTLMRQILNDKIRTYYRNPMFKRWLKQLRLIPLKSKGALE